MRYTHGLTHHPLFQVYDDMIKRCYKMNRPNYSDYGGRGIGVCDEWRQDKKLFFKWAQENGYEKGLYLDRRDNNGNYSPENCRFVTRRINNRNKRNTIYIKCKGEERPLSEWCEILNLNTKTCRKRLKSGWSPEDVLLKPLRSDLKNSNKWKANI